MKKLLKTTVITLLLTGTVILFSTGEVKAALQSNKNTQYKKAAVVATWVPLFRQMEQSGEALGLSEIFDGTTLLATSESNNIDSHMMKSTEYGAIAILSASGYGNPKNDKAITSTTDNDTGMMLNTSKWEWVAGGVSTGPAFQNIDARYFDEYTENSDSAKKGDALGLKWHSASEGNWVWSGYGYAFGRGGAGIFSFNNSHYVSGSAYARGVIVCGKGL